MNEMSIYIDNSIKKPIYEQIYEHIKKEIISGNISTGDMLPSTRNLSSNLQISRSTVILAYEQLLAEGYIESVPQSGYYALEIEKGFSNPQSEIRKTGSDTVSKKQKDIIDFSPDGIETEHFPYNEWRKISKQVFSYPNKDIFNSGDSRGDRDLRNLIVGYLHEARGVNTDSDRIILGAGNESLLMLINILISENSLFAMENPTYLKSYKILDGLGRSVIPVNMDSNGIRMDELEKSGADVAYVTPSHQYPLGIIMSIHRRQELLTWASKKAERYIIEDDYDSEFRYKGRPVPSLQGNDVNDKVIYIGTFSKSISPAIRMSYMILPKTLYKVYKQKAGYFSNTVSRIDQQIVKNFIETGAFGRNLNRMRKIYKNKHDAMINELKKWKNATIYGENSGAHMLIYINNGMNEKMLIKSAEKEGIIVYPLSDYYIGEKKNIKPIIMLGYARINEEQIKKGLKILKEIWKIKAED